MTGNGSKYYESYDQENIVKCYSLLATITPLRSQYRTPIFNTKAGREFLKTLPPVLVMTFVRKFFIWHVSRQPQRKE